MSDKVTLTIDGIEVTVPVGTTIYDAARLAGIDIPVICYHPNLTANGLCRVCSVDVGWRVLAAACVTPASEGMEVKTQTGEVRRARKTILEMLDATVNLEESPQIQAMLEAYDAEPERFAGARRETPVYDDNPFYIRDYNQCINCWRCVQVCGADAQYTYALSFDGRGFHTTIGTFMNAPMPDTTCVFCGQCVGVCPTGALKPKRQALLEQGMDPDEIFFATRQGRRRRKEAADAD
jgi:NADH dehydrogenase/NADH:ubiquinone oxidoreductase subunit G